MRTDWPFEDPPNVAVITSSAVIDGGRWIAVVQRDMDDGCWQFHSLGGAPTDLNQARVVSLSSMMQRDPSIGDLANLLPGDSAQRSGPGSPWVISRRADR